MTSSPSNDKDTVLVVAHADVGQLDAHAAILFQNAENQQQHSGLLEAASNQGVLQIYNLDLQAGENRENGESGVNGEEGGTGFYLVSLTTRQCVELAGSGASGVRASRQPKALALFSHAHTAEGLNAINAPDVRHLAAGEFTQWTDAHAEVLYKALTGREAPSLA